MLQWQGIMLKNSICSFNSYMSNCLEMKSVQTFSRHPRITPAINEQQKEIAPLLTFCVVCCYCQCLTVAKHVISCNNYSYSAAIFVQSILLKQVITMKWLNTAPVSIKCKKFDISKLTHYFNTFTLETK